MIEFGGSWRDLPSENIPMRILYPFPNEVYVPRAFLKIFIPNAVESRGDLRHDLGQSPFSILPFRGDRFLGPFERTFDLLKGEDGYREYIHGPPADD